MDRQFFNSPMADSMTADAVTPSSYTKRGEERRLRHEHLNKVFP